MSHYGHDMDHDGKITSKDDAMFHEMVNGSDYRRNDVHKSTRDIIGECMLLMFLVAVTPLVLLHVIGFIGSLLG